MDSNFQGLCGVYTRKEFLTSLPSTVNNHHGVRLTPHPAHLPANYAAHAKGRGDRHAHRPATPRRSFLKI